MRAIFLSLVLLATLGSAAAAQDPATDVQPRLLSTLRQINDAFARHDAAAVRRMLADGFTSTESGGRVFDAEQVAGRAANNPPDLVVREEILEPSTTVSASGDSATMRYRSVLAVEQAGRSLGTQRAWATAHFVRRGGEWLLAAMRMEPDEGS
ncbi:MAG TPA: nuclear transport factor 2 family protein [Longimicrobium sp.]